LIGDPPAEEEGENLLHNINVTIIMVIIAFRRFGMDQIQEYVPVTQAKTRLLDLVRKLKGSGDAIAITKNGVPEAVLISMEKFEGLLETVEILSDDKTMKALRRSMRDAEKGKWIAEDELSWE
jgi:antitoxin YefM